MRKTSLEALKKLIATDSLGRLYVLVLDTLKAKGPLTGSEIDQATKRRGLWKRLSELRRLGLVEEFFVRECRVTGRKALTWRICRNPKEKPLEKITHWFIVRTTAKKAQAFIDKKAAKKFADKRGVVIIKARESKR
jgi:hypothetical protein